MGSADTLRRTNALVAPGIDAEQERHAEKRVADLQRMVAILLEKNEELRQELAATGGPRSYEGSQGKHELSIPPTQTPAVK